MSNSGWTNDAVDTLTVPTGATTGQRVVIGNQANGDAIDVFDSQNRLVLEVTGIGALVTTDQPALDTVTVAGNGIGFASTPNPPSNAGSIIGLSNSTDSFLQLDSGNAAFGFGDSLITLGDAAFPGAGGVSNIKINSRGTTVSAGVTGTLVQTDSFGSGNNVVHAASYSGTTNAGGHLIFSHGCAFTPKVVVVTGTTPGGTFANLTYGVNAKTSTQVDINWTVANTGAAFASQGITFDAVMYG